MDNKSLGMLLIILFGIPGAVVITLAWFWPGLHIDKILATLGGMVGMGIALAQGLRLRRCARVAVKENSNI